MKFFITRTITALISGLIAYFVTNTLIERVDFTKVISGGSIGAAITSGGAILALFSFVFGFALYLVGFLVASVWGLIRHIGIWSMLALIASVSILTFSTWFSYENVMTQARKGISTSLNDVINSQYGADVKSKVTAEIDKIPADKMAKLQKESGLTKDQMQKMVEKGEYSELAKKLPSDFDGISIKDELSKKGVDTNSPLVKQLLGD
jgi:hypothetical protein